MIRYLLAAAAVLAFCAPALGANTTRPTSLTFTQGSIVRTLTVPPPSAYGKGQIAYMESLTNGVCRFTLGAQFVQFSAPCNKITRDWVYQVTTCPPVPPALTRPQDCAVTNPGTHGSWMQTATYSQSPYPGCVNTLGPYLPTAAPSGVCQVDQPPPPPGGLNLDLSFVDKSSAAYANFLSFANRLDEADPETLVWAKLLTNNDSYCTRAVALVDDLMTNHADAIADDSYLYVDGYLVGSSLTYAKCTTTTAQRARWKSVMDTTLANLWGGIGWSGWALDQWANNYHYSFMGATIYWALASGETSLISDVRNTRIPFVMNGLATIPGGGSLEGNGYGYAFKRFEIGMLAWRDSGQGDLANANAYTGNNVRYWVHGLVPTMDRFAPFGDQPRVSEPWWYDYNREEMLSGQYQTHDPIAKAEAGYALSHTPNPLMQSRDNYIGNMYPYTPTNVAPVLVYRAPEVGAVFARTAWNAQATWFAILAGRFEQSHAAREQGSFTLFGKGNWLAVTNNIHSSSGIQQGSRDRNMPRFVRNGQVKEQDYAAAIVTAYTPAANGDVHIVADLSPLYQIGDNGGVQRWQRTADFVGGSLTISDAFTLASGTAAVEQIQLPALPTIAGNVITAGHLRVTVISPANAQISVVDMTSVDSDYASGFRAEWPANGGAQFKLEVTP